MPPEVRSATVMDATAICNVLRRSITECCVADHRGDPGMISAWLENKTPEDVVAWIQSPSAVAVVATRPNSLVGFALSSDEEFALCHVIHEALHQGIGELLLAAIESRSVAHGIAMLRLESTRTASQFYLRNGSFLLGRSSFWRAWKVSPWSSS